MRKKNIFQVVDIVCYIFLLNSRMIGAMPAVAVRHERRRQEKRLKRPSQLYLGGQWMPPLQGSPPTPSPHGQNSHLDPLPELYLCGKVFYLDLVLRSFTTKKITYKYTVKKKNRDKSRRCRC